MQIGLVGINKGGETHLGPHTHQTGSFGLSACEGREKGWSYSLVGPTNIVTLEIRCLEEVASGGTVGDGEGGEKEGWEQIEMD